MSPEYVFFAYLAVGLPVAYIFMQKNEIAENLPQVRLRMGVMFILASMWPFLTFAMALRWFQERSKPNNASADAPAPGAQATNTVTSSLQQNETGHD